MHSIQVVLNNKLVQLNNTLQNLLNNSLWVLFGTGVGLITSLITTIFLAKLLSPDTYGMYRYALTLIPFLGLFTLTGMRTAVTWGKLKNNCFSLKKIMQKKAISGLIGTLFALPLSYYYYSAGNQTLATLVFMIGLANPLYELFYIHHGILQGHEKFKESALNLLKSKSILALSLIACGLLLPNIYVLVGASILVPIAVHYHQYKQTIGRKKEMQLNTNNNVFIYGIYLSIFGALGAFAEVVDKFYVWYSTDAFMFATYSLALVFPAMIAALIGSTTVVLLPHFVRIEWDKALIIKLLKKIFQLSILTSLVAATYALIAPSLLSLIFPEYGSEIAPLSIIFSVLIILIPAHSLLIQLLIATQRKISVNIILLLSITSYLLLTLFINSGDIISAALILVFKELAMLLFAVFCCLAISKKNAQVTHSL